MFNNNNNKMLTHPTSLMLFVGKIYLRQTTLATPTTSPLRTNSTQPTRLAGMIAGITAIIKNHSTIVAQTTSVFLVLILILLLRTMSTQSSRIGIVVGASDFVTTRLTTINTTSIYILVGVHCHNEPPPPSASRVSHPH